MGRPVGSFVQVSISTLVYDLMKTFKNTILRILRKISYGRGIIGGLNCRRGIHRVQPFSIPLHAEEIVSVHPIVSKLSCLSWIRINVHELIIVRDLLQDALSADPIARWLVNFHCLTTQPSHLSVGRRSDALRTVSRENLGSPGCAGPHSANFHQFDSPRDSGAQDRPLFFSFAAIYIFVRGWAVKKIEAGRAG